MARVTLQNIAKVYPGPGGGVEAVRDFSLDIADGELAVLVGPSGCGKSTTLRIVAGLEEATSGTVSIGGRIVNGIHPKDRDIAMVFQNYALYPHMTVYGNMAFALRLRRVPRAQVEKRVRAAAMMLGIDHLLDRKPRQLSGGQRQRVAVGRAIVREPKAFLFDEPLSNLDARLRVTTRAELKALHQRLNATTIYVTHDQEEAMTLGDRVVVMSQGRIQQTGTPLAVYNHPANRFVAGFIGMPPMNFLIGALRRDGADLWFEAQGPDGLSLAGRLPIPPDHAAALESAGLDRGLVLGVRPQALSEPNGSPRAALAAHVRVVEPLGDSMDIYATLPGGAEVVARVPAHERLRTGQGITLAVDMARIHYFAHGAFGRSLLPA